MCIFCVQIQILRSNRTSGAIPSMIIKNLVRFIFFLFFKNEIIVSLNTLNYSNILISRCLPFSFYHRRLFYILCSLSRINYRSRSLSIIIIRCCEPRLCPRLLTHALPNPRLLSKCHASPPRTMQIFYPSFQPIRQLCNAIAFSWTSFVKRELAINFISLYALINLFCTHTAYTLFSLFQGKGKLIDLRNR